MRRKRARVSVVVLAALVVAGAVGLCGAATGDRQTALRKPIKLQLLFPDLKDASACQFLRLYGTAVDAYNNRCWDEMSSLGRAVLRAKGRTPNETAFGHLLVGIALFRQKEFDAADGEFSKVLEIPVAQEDRAAYNGTALWLSGMVRLAKKDYPKAADRLAPLLRQYPTLKASWHGLRGAVQAFSRSGRSAQLLELLSLVAESAAGTQTALEALWYLGVEYEKKNKLQLACETYQRLIDEFPKSPTARVAKKRLELLGKSGSAACCK